MTEMTQTTGHKVIVLGAGYAGLLAVIRLAQQPRHQALQITLINGSDRFVERIRLHQLATGQRLPARPLKPLLAGTGITFVQGLVTAIQADEKTISVQTADQLKTMAYDTLVCALGSQVDRQRLPGVSDYAYTLDPRSATELMARLAALRSGGKVLIVGGGLTGIEAAAEIAERYPELCVQMVTSGQLGSDLSRAGQEYLRRVFARLKIALLEQTPVRALTSDRALTTTGEKVPFDVCVYAGGFTVSALARQAGLAVNTAGQIVVDPFLRSLSHPDVFAIGDCASLAENSGLSLRMACATAMPMAAHAADTIGATLAGRTPAPFAFGYALRCISLGRARGLVQVVNRSDVARDRIFTGRQGAIVKELICRYTFVSLQLARRSSQWYQWPHFRQPPLNYISPGEAAI